VLQDLRAQASTDQITNRESGESAIPIEVDTEHCPCGPDTAVHKRLLEPRRLQMDNGDRVADQRQRRPHALERLRLVGDGEVAGLPPRGRAQLRQVNREPLLEFARTRRRDQGRTRQASADVDQQPRPIWLRASASERRCRRL
jgi:hypothetical protein